MNMWILVGVDMSHRSKLFKGRIVEGLGFRI